MRTWVKATIGAAVVVIACLAALAGTAGYFVMRSLERRSATESVAQGEIDGIRGRFGTRPPLIEVVDPRTMDVRINRVAGGGAAPVSTLHVVSWKAEDNEIARTEVPLWLMRFSTLNVLSQLGVVPAKIRLTVQDVDRYGPGIVVDYNKPGSFRVLVWAD